MSIAQKQIFTCEKQKKDKPCIVYNNEPLGIVESLKYLGVEVASNHRWNECVACCVDARKGGYYAFNGTCYPREIKSWAVKKYLLTCW